MARTPSHSHHWLGAILLVALLALTACGGEEAPDAEIPATPTLIPTLPAPATLVPAQPPATAEPIVIEEPTEEVGEEAAAEEAEATEEDPESPEVITTEEITDTEELPEPEVITTEEITDTEELPEPDVITTEEITDTEELPEPDVITTEEITDTEEVPEPEVITTEDITDTEELPEPEVITTEDVADTDEMTAASDANLFFLQPTANAIVPLTFTVVISYTGLDVVAGHEHGAESPGAENESAENAGHVHLLIDSPFVEPGETIPSDSLHYHFADGSTSAQVSVPPGTHTLRLQYANSDHVALEGEQYREEIVVNVVEGAPEASVRIASPTFGATVPPNFTVVMAATGLNVEPAGVASEGAGHFHLLVDEPYVAAGEIIPTDATHLHFGKAQLTTTLTLEPGTYLLRLQMADGTHRALAGAQYRDEVQVVVEEGAPEAQVMFIKPADDATVTSPFLVGWAASGLLIESAGAVSRPEGGHLHVLIDEEFVPDGEPIPVDETHLHFGGGQTNTELTLEPGEHTLRLQMANGGHLAQDGTQYQDEITVTVR